MPERTAAPVAGFRLSPQQERLFAARSMGAGFRAQCLVELRGPVDEQRLAAALEGVIRRHEILRTTFARPTGLRTPSQVVNERIAPWWEKRPGHVEPLALAALDQLALEEAERRLDPEAGPLVRALLLTLPPERWLLALTLPAVCADQTSLLEMLQEIAVLYGADASVELQEPLQHADYAEWRHELVGGDDPEAVAGREFWRSREDASWEQPPPLLFGRVPVPDGARGVRRQEVPLDPALVAALPTAALRATPGLLLEASWHALVMRLMGSESIVIGSLLHGRHHADLEGAIGPFAQSVPIRSRAERGTTFAEVLEQVRFARGQAERWQDYRPVDGGSAAIGFELVEVPALPPIGEGGVVLHLLRARSEPHALALSCRIEDDVVTGELEYDPGAYDADDVAAIGASWATLLQSAVAEPDAPVARLIVLPARDRQRLVVDLSRAAADVPPECVHQMFERQARLNPTATAVVAGERSLSYAELDAAANRVALRLRELGVGPDSVVGLCLDRSCELLAALLGILKAGGAYLPLNLEHPPARLTSQLEQAGARVLVTLAGLLDRFESFDGERVCLDRDAAALEAARAGDQHELAGPEHIAYVMFTSGSTGTPKGVAVTHGNLANYVRDMAQRLAADAPAGMTFAVVSAISTDLGNTCVFPSLASGGTLHLVSPEASMQGPPLADYVEANRIDVLKITPSHLGMLMSTAPGRSVLPRRCLVLGGEALRWDLVETVRKQSDCRILNHYGPTETTVGSCTFEVDSGLRPAGAATVPIGRPIANTSVYVLDEGLEPLPVGAPGELFIGGAGVSRGYVGRPEETAERFVDDPFAEEPNARLYRTGDRARLLRDGSLEFLGRVDDQVKVRGHRVEPAEIEAVLLSHPAVREAAVVAIGGASEEQRLVGYVVAPGALSMDDLRAHLHAFLPDHMVPSDLAQRDALPLTASGKVDRRLLGESDVFQAAREAAYVAPRTPLEEELVEMWEGLFGISPIGVTADFFELGGHSLLAARFMARVQTSFGVELFLRSIFEHRTVAEFAEVLAERLLADDSDGDASVPTHSGNRGAPA